jgi:hypothetical protein
VILTITVLSNGAVPSAETADGAAATCPLSRKPGETRRRVSLPPQRAKVKA